MTVALQAWVAIRSLAVAARSRLADEAGEGVIGMAIAVLIVAVLGAAMWSFFNDTFTDIQGTVTEKVDEIN